MFLKATCRRLWSSSAQVLHYSSEFGSAPVPAQGASEAALEYEQHHRISGGSLGLVDGKSALRAGPSVAVSPAELPAATGLQAIGTTQVASPPLFSSLPLKEGGSTGAVFPIPTTRFAKGKLVLAVGHHELDDISNVSPGTVSEEAVDENSFETTTANLGPGSFILDMEFPNRLCGVVLADGTIMSAKDPWFIVNWVSHVLPDLATEDQGKYPPPLLQYINDVKRTIVKNQADIPSMRLCQSIFVKNSIEDFGYFML